MSTTTAHESKAAVAGLTVARVIVGIIFAAHGFQKLDGFAEWQQHVVGMGLPFPTISAWLGVAGELLGGLGLIVGLLTPIAAFGALCTMLVAILKVHLPHGFFAQDHGFEYPLALAAAAFFFMLRGAGPISLDAWIARAQRLERLAPARGHDGHAGADVSRLGVRTAKLAGVSRASTAMHA